MADARVADFDLNVRIEEDDNIGKQQHQISFSVCCMPKQFVCMSGCMASISFLSLVFLFFR